MSTRNEPPERTCRATSFETARESTPGWSKENCLVATRLNQNDPKCLVWGSLLSSMEVTAAFDCALYFWVVGGTLAWEIRRFETVDSDFLLIKDIWRSSRFFSKRILQIHTVFTCIYYTCSHQSLDTMMDDVHATKCNAPACLWRRCRGIRWPTRDLLSSSIRSPTLGSTIFLMDGRTVGLKWSRSRQMSEKDQISQNLSNQFRKKWHEIVAMAADTARTAVNHIESINIQTDPLTNTNTMFEHQLLTTTCPFLSSTRPSTAPSSVLSLVHGATSAAPASKCRYSAPGQHLAMAIGRHPEASFHDIMPIVWTMMLMMLMKIMKMTVRRRDTSWNHVRSVKLT